MPITSDKKPWVAIMMFTDDISDRAALQELGERLARYRLNLNLTQAALAEEAGVSPRTLHRIEHGLTTNIGNVIRILRALRLLGNLEALVPAPAVSPIQQAKMQGKARRRASSRSGPAPSEERWTWGDEV